MGNPMLYKKNRVNLPSNFGKDLTQARIRMNISQNRLAKKLGIQQGLISSVERGLTKSLTKPVYHSLINVLDTHLPISLRPKKNNEARELFKEVDPILQKSIEETSVQEKQESPEEMIMPHVLERLNKLGLQQEAIQSLLMLMYSDMKDLKRRN